MTLTFWIVSAVSFLVGLGCMHFLVRRPFSRHRYLLCAVRLLTMVPINFVWGLAADIIVQLLRGR